MGRKRLSVEYGKRERNKGPTFSVQKKYNIFAEGLEGGSASGQDFDDFISDFCCRGLIGPRVMSRDHILLIEDKLGRSSEDTIHSTPEESETPTRTRIIG